jgi:hypothetical protein
MIEIQKCKTDLPALAIQSVLERIVTPCFIETDGKPLASVLPPGGSLFLNYGPKLSTRIAFAENITELVLLDRSARVSANRPNARSGRSGTL